MLGCKGLISRIPVCDRNHSGLWQLQIKKRRRFGTKLLTREWRQVYGDDINFFHNFLFNGKSICNHISLSRFQAHERKDYHSKLY